MKYRVFPGTNVRVSEVGFGTWTIATSWWGEKTDAEAVDMLRSALDDHGVFGEVRVGLLRSVPRGGRVGAKVR